MPNIGLDIGAAFIKLVQTEKSKVVATAIANNPLGKISPDTESEVDQLAASIKKLFMEHKIREKKVRLALSESVAYSRVIEMPVLSTAELSNAIKYEAEQYIPVSLEDVELSYEVISRPAKKTGEEKMIVLLVAASTRTLNGIVTAMAKAGLETESIETEMVATARALVIEKKVTDVTMLVSIGAVSTGISIFDGQNLVFTHRLDTGSAAMTRAISTTLSLPILQAEEYKRSYGVRSDVLEGKLVAAVAPITTNLVNEIKKAQLFISQSDTLGAKPVHVLLSGGGALVPGFLELISQTTGMEATIGQAALESKSGDFNTLYIAAAGASIR
jgi:type IV pilus assembly protein PilM